LININTGRIVDGHADLRKCHLSDCLKFAYSLTTEDQIVGPDWIRMKNVRFDVVAKAAAETPNDQLLLMLQALLKERFQMTLLTEQKGMTSYELVLGEKWTQMRESTVGPDEGRGAGYPIDRLSESRHPTSAEELKQA
jgi:uncharacterized protein (TIGR03435 family)